MKVSIIMASYNYAEYILEAIESVVKQVYHDWELIIVDDGSSDNSVNIIKSYCKTDYRIKLFTHEGNINKGLPETLKLGVKKATGEWIAFLESDDILNSDAIFRRVQLVKKHQNINLIFNDVDIFGESEILENVQKYIFESKKILKNLIYPCNMLKYIEKRNLIPTFSSVMVKKSELLKCDFSCPVKALLDHYLWIQLALDNEFYYLDKPLSRWRMHSNSFINTYEKNPNNKLEMKIKINSTLSNFYKKNFFKHIYYKLIVLKCLIKRGFVK